MSESAKATSPSMVVFTDAVAYGQYWEGCGKPAQFVYNTKGSQGFVYQGFLVVLTPTI